MILFFLLFLGIMVVAAIYDLVSYTIPNFLPLLLIGAFVVFALWQALSWPLLANHAGAGLGMLGVGWALFALGLLGGGDASCLRPPACGWDGMGFLTI